jgi:ComF family protein
MAPLPSPMKALEIVMGDSGAFASRLSGAGGLIRTMGRMVLDALVPPQCLGCGTIVEAPGALCADCFTGFRFLASPLCRVCGCSLPDADADRELLCAACLRQRPDFNQARAVFAYDNASRGLILKFKNGDRTDAAVHLARWMQRAGAELISACDVIVPVPLHRWRLLTRSYNQSALLANALGRLTKRKVVPDGLSRIRATKSQGHLDRHERRRNVADAFRVRRPELIQSRRVLLIDDVLTTGSTAEACTRALLAGGARLVDLLVLARVPGPAG